MRESTIEFGARGEEAASDYLRARGYDILARNWRTGRGEVDIVARDGETAVIVEVKTRAGTGFGHPFEAITREKAARLRMLARLWCRETGWTGRSVRIDAIGVLWARGSSRPTIEHLIEVC